MSWAVDEWRPPIASRWDGVKAYWSEARAACSPPAQRQTSSWIVMGWRRDHGRNRREGIDWGESLDGYEAMATQRTERRPVDRPRSRPPFLDGRWRCQRATMQNCKHLNDPC